MMNGNQMEVQMMNGEVAEVKELRGRVQLMEKFMEKQFGNAFWEFVQEHADPGDYEDLARSPPLAPAVTVTLSETMNDNSSASTSSEEPPPPLPFIPASSLASLTGNGNDSGNSTNSRRLSGARNFLPKSFANGAKAKSRATSLTSNDSYGSSHSLHHVGSLRLNSTEENRETIVTKPRSNGGEESILKSALKSSPVMVASTCLNNRAKSNPVLGVGSTLPRKPSILKRAAPIHFPKVDEDDQEPEEKRMMTTMENASVYPAISYMPANRSVNIIRTANGIKAETDGYSFAHNGFVRELRPIPCHIKCQNRCHENWTDADRMDVFQVYWSIPTEAERKQWVAEKIESVAVATKKTEYSNFRTCTFKYYLPHPQNPRLQVCKNFVIATIDEKRSYVEKIAQKNKGFGEHNSLQEIPFRRRNQLLIKGANGNSLNYGNQTQFYGYADAVGWMTGVGVVGQEDEECEEVTGENSEQDGVDHTEEEMV